MIRVAVNRPGRLERILRSIPSIELAREAELVDVLLVEDDPAWPRLADSPVPVILLVDAFDAAAARQALRAGIAGVLPNDAGPREIEGAIQAVYAGLSVTQPAWNKALAPRSSVPSGELIEPLSERELEVLELLAEGLGNKLIAGRLGISDHTAKTHVASILAKLESTTRTEAVAKAIRRGLVML